MNEQFFDRLSAGVKRALDTLFVANPTGTSLGIFTGIVLHGVLQFLGPVLSRIEEVRFSAIRLWHLCAGGIIAFNIRPYIRRSKIDPKVTEVLAFIHKEAERQKMTGLQRKRMYENLLAKVLADVVLDSPTQESIEVLRSSISRERT